MAALRNIVLWACFHCSDIQQADILTFWQEMTLKQKPVNNNCFISVFKYLNLDWPSGQMESSFTFSSTNLPEDKSFQETPKKDLYIAYIHQQLIAAPDKPSWPMKDSGWRQTGSSTNDRICGLRRNKTKTVKWNDSKRWKGQIIKWPELLPETNRKEAVKIKKEYIFIYPSYVYLCIKSYN